MKRYLLFITAFLTLIPLCTKAQGIDDMTLEGRFAAQVKSFDEFLARYNGAEMKKNKDGEYTEYSVISLFDSQMPRGNNPEAFKASVMEFVKAVNESKKPLLVNDSNIFAKAESVVKFQGKERNITLVLQCQEFKPGVKRWAIVGVDGLQKSGMIDTTKVRAISPVDHEIHFMGLTNTFKYSTSEIVGFRGAGTHIDQLSMFLAFAQLKSIEFICVDNLTYHILSVPGYVFTVNEINRKDYNTGWLITSFKKIDDKEKASYIDRLLGK